MTLHTLFSRSAPLAIAASGALFATSAMAQEAAPADNPIVLPPVVEPAAPTAASEPAPIVLPDPVVEETAPVAEAAPVTTNAAPATAAPETKTERTPAVPRTSSTPSTRASAPVVESAPVLADTPAPAALPVAAQPATADVVPAEAPTARPSGYLDEALIAGLLGAGGLAVVGGIAFASARRRRDRSIERRSHLIEPRPVAPTVREPVHAPIAATQFSPATQAPFAGSQMAGHGDPVPLPREISATVEERVALIERLANAKPDKANPFTSRKARVKRARMIVNALGMNFANRKPRIDLSEYTSRWPALRGWRPATS